MHNLDRICCNFWAIVLKDTTKLYISLFVNEMHMLCYLTIGIALTTCINFMRSEGWGNTCNPYFIGHYPL